MMLRSPVLSAGALLLLSLGSGAQTGPASATAETLQFSLDRSGPPVEKYTVTVNSNGIGSFLAPGDPATPGPRPLHVGPVTLKKLLAAIPLVEGGRCETHLKGIAKTGQKTLQYIGNGHNAQCTYNYSDEDRVNDATASFEAIANTLEVGDRLRAKLRFDRLGLDSELELLEAEAKDNRAMEIGNIAPVLKAITDDERVMEHARRRAERLLQDAGTAAGTEETQPAAAPSSDR